MEALMRVEDAGGGADTSFAIFRRRCVEVVQSGLTLENELLQSEATVLGLSDAQASQLIRWARNRQPEPEALDEAPDLGETWDQLNTEADEEEHEPWLLKGVLPPRGVVLVLGEQKSGKTLWVASLVGYVLANRTPATYVMQESAQSILRARMRLGLGEGKELFRSLYRRGHHLKDEDGLMRLVSAVRGNNSKLVVLDSLTRFCHGLDLNKAEVMSAVGDRLERLSQLAECCVVVIHHPRKNGSGQNARKELSSSDARGSGDILAVATVIALVERVERTAAHEYGFTVRCEDSWYEPFEKLNVTVRFRQVPAIVSEKASEAAEHDNDDLRVAMVEAIEAAPFKRLSMNAVFESAHVKALSKNSRLLRKLLEGLIGDGRLLESPGLRGARMVSLPEDLAQNG